MDKQGRDQFAVRYQVCYFHAEAAGESTCGMDDMLCHFVGSNRGVLE